MEQKVRDYLFDIVIESADMETIEKLKHDKYYQSIKEKQKKIYDDYPVIGKILDRKESVSMSEKEHKAMLEYYAYEKKREALERKEYYWCGHKHAYAYLQAVSEK